MRVLVTGGAGFIGSTLVDRLLADGHHVVALDDLSTGRLANLGRARTSGRFELVRRDVTAAGLDDVVAAATPEAVCHLAAQMDVRVSVADPLLDARLNVVGTVNVLEAAVRAGVRKVVFASSGGSIYGTPQRLPVSEQQPVAPESPYAAGKVAGEVYLGTYRRLHGLDFTSLALGNVYGPRQDPHGEAGVVAIFARALLAGRPGTIYGDGSAVRDYVYVDDVVDAFVRALEPSFAPGERVNIGTGAGTSVRELHTVLAGLTGTPDEPVLAPARRGELDRIVLEVALAGAHGWRPRTPLAAGLAATVESLRSG